MFSQNEDYFLEKQVKMYLSDTSVYKKSIKEWLNKLANLKKRSWKDITEEKKIESYEFYIEDSNLPWEKEYRARMNLAIGGVFASESYFSAGAIRVVVGSQQMRNDLITKKLTTVDHWNSFIENFGDVLKEFDRSCNPKSQVGQVNTNKNIYKEGTKFDTYNCLLKLSKYLNRAFVSIDFLLNDRDIVEKQKKKEKDKRKKEIKS